MADKTFTPFNSNRASPTVPCLPTTLSIGPLLSGTGSPEGVVPGVVGECYRDNATLNLWRKMAGTQKIGWQLIGKVAPIDIGAVDVASDGSVWGKSATGWYLLVAPP